MKRVRADADLYVAVEHQALRVVHAPCAGAQRLDSYVACDRLDRQDEPADPVAGDWNASLCGGRLIGQTDRGQNDDGAAQRDAIPVSAPPTANYRTGIHHAADHTVGYADSQQDGFSPTGCTESQVSSEPARAGPVDVADTLRSNAR